jgi:hypothetical protein
MSRTALPAALIATLTLSLAASGTHAQTSSDAETAALAEAQRGLAARRDGRDDEARQAFERSLALAPRASVRAQLGFALQALGRWVEADAALGAAAALEDPWVERHRATIDAALAEIRAHLGTLTLSVLPEDASLRIDGVPTSVGVATRLPAGSVTISVQREGYFGTERVVLIRGGDTLRESFELRARASGPGQLDEPTPLPAPTPETEADEPTAALLLPTPAHEETRIEEARHWGGPTIALGTGAVSLGVGFALLAARDTALANLLSHGCVETPTEYLCTSSDAAAAQASHAEAETFAAASTATLATGATLLLLGTGWLLVEWLRPPSTYVEAGVRVTPRGVQWTF